MVKLKRELAEVEDQIAATKKRLPAHSAKPPIMLELFELEDKYERLLKQVQHFEKNE